MLPVNSALLAPSPILDYTGGKLEALVKARGWRDLPERERIGPERRGARPGLLACSSRHPRVFASGIYRVCAANLTHKTPSAIEPAANAAKRIGT